MEEKTNKKSFKIIIGIIVILLIVAVGGGILLYINNKNSIKTEWGEFYYQILERESKKNEGYTTNENGELEKKEYDEYANTSNVSMQFIQLAENTIPIMAVKLEKDGQKIVKIYLAYESEEQKNPNSKYMINMSQYPSFYQEENSSNYDIQLLYNLEEQKYIWYIHTVGENKEETFTPVIYDLKQTLNVDSTEKSYHFTEEEMKTNQTAEDGTPILSKFEETFIVVENVDNSIEIGNIHNIDGKELKKHIKSAETKYKDINSVITEEIKTATETKIAEIENKKEQIKVAEEEKAKAEEETKKKVEEETSEGLKVGDYTLKYGIYKDNTYGNILNLKQGGICTFADKECTYKVEQYDFSQHEIPNYKIGIIVYQAGQEYLSCYPNSNTKLYTNGPLIFEYQENTQTVKTNEKQ